MKDPAVLFYSSDFLTGVSDLTMEERGQYITLLCLQHQKGHLTKKMINISVGNAAADVLAKFEIDKDGKYFNRRLNDEKEKRRKHSEKQSIRAKEGWKKRKDSQSHGNATAMPLEDEDEDAVKDILNRKKEKTKTLIEKQKAFQEDCRQFLGKQNKHGLVNFNLLDDFYQYWSAPIQNKPNTMLKETMRTWDTYRRILTWQKKEKTPYVKKHTA